MIGIDLKGTLSERREFVSDKMLSYLKDVVLITGQDIKDPQLNNLINRIKIKAYMNNGAIFWDGIKINNILKLNNQENILLLVIKFI